MEQIKGKYYKSTQKLVLNINGKSHSRIADIKESEKILSKVEILNKLIRGKKTKAAALKEFQEDIIKLMTPKEELKKKEKEKEVAKVKGEKKALKKEVKKAKSTKTTKKKEVAKKIKDVIEKSDVTVDEEGKLSPNISDVVNTVKEAKQEEPKAQTSSYRRSGEY